MPTYDYRCDACKYEFEKFQSMTEKAVRKCPKCGKSFVKRLIGRGAGIIFKGSGFYHTDYKKTAKKETEKPAAEAPAKKESTAAEPHKAKPSQSEGKK